mmetsp:Transcript_31412/g.82060  ORF Transcript_31412/g.82060 Transcript_31412/m.82060 type:complete len:151 (+) Transcript_31412:27-479(+)|eukprot:CAMPEP_0115865564 /NCGR_PEP_ID=MMETSP0287-20121206/19787_1 /TAXON_ID=412157 /ORGANISM="Chrysochromulina rotalis, Strain UIO044" /LENGTH=150 /DNA_ID=CAMNT_0003320081 /DNA_START=27 /DNA_END=479 /DNA_ORIENTATION=-
MFRFLLCALSLSSAAGLVFSPVPQNAAATCSRSSTVSMAHHVQKKATRAHNAYRPRKSRPSDIYRTPPSYPALPDIPWMSKLDSVSSVSKQTVSIEVSPDDTAVTLSSKLVAAGAAAPDNVSFQGKAVTGSLADCGLQAATTIEAEVVSN